MPEPVETPAAALMRLTNGYQVSQAIHVAAELRLADFIGDEPVTADAIAPRVGAHAPSLYRLLRALSTVGIFRKTDDKRFVGSPMSDLLRTDHPRSMWGWPAFIGRPHQREMWGDLLHSVRTGQDAPHHLWGVDVWQYRADKPEEIAGMNAAMAAVSRTVAPAIVAVYDFSRFGRIVDVGGANGALLVAILTVSPRSSGIVFDLPPVVREAASVIREAGLEGRCEAVGGSWDAVPAGGDAYVIKAVLVDTTDEEAATLLRNVRSAMGPRGTLLVIDRLIGTPNEGAADAFIDITMLVGTGGAVRRQNEWAAVFAAGGFKLDSVTPTASRFYVLEGHPSESPVLRSAQCSTEASNFTLKRTPARIRSPRPLSVGVRQTESSASPRGKQWSSRHQRTARRSLSSGVDRVNRSCSSTGQLAARRAGPWLPRFWPSSSPS